MPGFPNRPPVDRRPAERALQAGERRDRGHVGAVAVRPRVRRMGPLLRLEQQQPHPARGAGRALSRRAIPTCRSRRRWTTSRITDRRRRSFPITERPTYELLTEAGEFTSACSLTPYTGGAFPGEYAHSTFVAEPVHNLVHRDVLAPDGASLRARRGSEGREFLASTDAWFRPVSFYVAPGRRALCYRLL